MKDKPKLKLIKERSILSASNNFWRCCPLNKEYLPESSCPEGKPQMIKNKLQEEPNCSWWINSSEHNFCFWRYVKDKSDSDGMMKELVQAELAALFGWSNTKTHFMLKQAMVELTQALKEFGALELLEDLDSEDGASLINVNDFIDPNRDEPTE